MSRLTMERKSVIYSTIQSTRHVRYVLLNAYSSMCVFFPFRAGRATIRVYRCQVYRQDILSLTTRGVHQKQHEHDT